MLSALLLSFACCTAANYPSSAPITLSTDTYAHVGRKPVRQERPLFLGGEFGFNGLTGVGFTAGYQLNDYLALDGSVGASFQGVRTGLRARLNFLKSAVTPFVGAGVIYGSGTAFDVNAEVDGRAFHYRIMPAAFFQGVGGVSWVHRNGFTALLSLGWSQLLQKGDNFAMRGGRYNSHDVKTIGWLVGSAPVASLALGYSF